MPKNVGGRPPLVPTAEMRRKVAIAAGGGMSHEEMAIALGITRPTLEKHFAFELNEGAYKKRMEAFTALHRAAKKGNVAAIRQYMSMSPRVGLPQAPAPAPTAKKEEPVGKKAQAQADAVTAAQGTEWESLLNRPEQTH